MGSVELINMLNILIPTFYLCYINYNIKYEYILKMNYNQQKCLFKIQWYTRCFNFINII